MYGVSEDDMIHYHDVFTDSGNTGAQVHTYIHTYIHTYHSVFFNISSLSLYSSSFSVDFAFV